MQPQLCRKRKRVRRGGKGGLEAGGQPVRREGDLPLAGGDQDHGVLASLQLHAPVLTRVTLLRRLRLLWRLLLLGASGRVEPAKPRVAPRLAVAGLDSAVLTHDQLHRDALILVRASL